MTLFSSTKPKAPYRSLKGTLFDPFGVFARNAQTSVEATHISRSSPAAGATIVTDTRAEAYLEQMIILLRAWINATVTGRDPRTSRAAEHNCPSLSFTRGRTATLERDLMQIHSFLLDQETCWALLEWFTLLEQTRVHWQDQNQLWWDLFQLANDVEDWLRTAGTRASTGVKESM